VEWEDFLELGRIKEGCRGGYKCGMRRVEHDQLDQIRSFLKGHLCLHVPVSSSQFVMYISISDESYETPFTIPLTFQSMYFHETRH
jgi:hypothetical protein